VGWLFAWNAGSGADSDLRDAPGLRGLVTARDREVAEMAGRQAELTDQVAALAPALPANDQLETEELALAAGAVAVTGPGLTVTLDDADQAPDFLADSPIPGEELVVHQQDIDAVINALWAGGAEAMAVQGHRVTSATKIKCVGNVILVGGRVYSPPFEISAIGPAEDMRQRLDDAPLVRAYRERAERVGLTWRTMDQAELTIPGDTAPPSALRYAKALDEPTIGQPTPGQLAEPKD
jgi:uncharacterized protein YlxW (UPF0749 family)